MYLYTHTGTVQSLRNFENFSDPAQLGPVYGSYGANMSYVYMEEHRAARKDKVTNR